MPVLGLCMGMQLLFESTEEHGGAEGIGLLKGRVERFERTGEGAADRLEPGALAAVERRSSRGSPNPVRLLPRELVMRRGQPTRT